MRLSLEYRAAVLGARPLSRLYELRTLGITVSVALRSEGDCGI